MHSFLCLLAQESEIQKRAKAVCKTKKTKKNNDARPRHVDLLTTFGNVFWGGRSQHSSDMFALLTQKSAVVETIKKRLRIYNPQPRCQKRGSLRSATFATPRGSLLFFHTFWASSMRMTSATRILNFDPLPLT